MSLTTCPDCTSRNSDAVFLCPQCGRSETASLLIRYTRQDEAPEITPDPGIAALMSLFFPGAGQMYRGKAKLGLACFAATLAGYVTLLIPGVILHVLCVAHAATD